MVLYFCNNVKNLVKRGRCHVIGAPVGLILAISGIGPAFAEFAVCNQSIDVINVAVGQEVTGEFQTEGWWTVGANQCANVVRKPLDSRFIYVFATDVFGQDVLNGSTPMCVGVKRFVIRGDDNCWERGYRQERFYEVDTQSVERWTLFISPLQ